MTEPSIAELREKFRSEKITDMSDTKSARLSAVEFVISHLEGRECDNEWVSDCMRCNALALARWMLKDLRGDTEIERLTRELEEDVEDYSQLQAERDRLRAALVRIGEQARDGGWVEHGECPATFACSAIVVELIDLGMPPEGVEPAQPDEPTGTTMEQGYDLASAKAAWAETRYCLQDLLAMVKGECPSLLEDYFMTGRYEDAAREPQLHNSTGATK